MKSIFSRFKSDKERDPKAPSSARPSSSASLAARLRDDNDKDKNVRSRPLLPKRASTSTPKTSSSNPTSTLGPPSIVPLRAHSPSSMLGENHRPHSVHGTLRDMDLSPVVGWDDGTERGRTVSASGEQASSGGAGKKVTFRSPVPTPTASVVLDEAVNLHVPNERGRPPSRSSDRRTPSTSPTKRHSTSALKPSIPSSFSRPPTAQSTDSARPRPTSRQTSPFLPSLAIRPQALRKASLPPLSRPSYTPRPGSTSPTKSPMVMSPTPSDVSTGASARSYIAPPNSWSEMAEDDLIANLGPKERTRQEVLWEIVSSEERYVQDLMKLNDTFCRSLLPPSATSPHLELFDPLSTLSRAMSPLSVTLSGNESYVNLPIAAKYATSPTPGSRPEIRYPSDSSSSTAPPVTPDEDFMARGTMFPPSSAARINAYNILTNGRPSEPSRKASFSSLSGKHHSLPPPSRQTSGVQTQLTADNRISYNSANGHNKLHKAQSCVSSGGSFTSREFKLPEDLEKVLTVLAGGILEGHLKLARALKLRYEDQYPLVRSLADVFTAHSYILREYSTYVLHLEKALGQVNEALSTFTDSHSNSSSSKPKRISRRMEESDIWRLGRYLFSLEELAAERGEAGLVISLSKPFQRLLKYPLLFQNLLFNTDPSLREYEATLAMVDEVEGIVRTIEDEKSNEEVREKTRDVWARIDGLERDKIIMAPKSNRVLISETQLVVPSGVHLKVKSEPSASVKGKKSFKRLSDILKGHGEVSDLWVIRFSDVSLLCEKTGVTHLPLSSLQKGSGSKHDLTAELGSKKHGTMGRRSASIRARNIYKFVKVHEWHLKETDGSRDALVDMHDISLARQRSVEPPYSPPASKAPTLPSIAGTPHATPTKVPLKTTDGSANPSPSKSLRTRLAERDDDTDTVVSETMSVMSFAFKGGDQLSPNLKARPKKPNAQTGTKQNGRTVGGSATGNVRSTSQPGLHRRISGGHVAGQAANAKFAHRLRSPDLDHSGPVHNKTHYDGRSSAAGAAPKARRSLPPTMTMSGGLRPLHTASSATYNNLNTLSNRPAWNSGLSTASQRRASTPASQAGSVRGGASAQGSSSAGKRVPIGRASMGLAPRPRESSIQSTQNGIKHSNEGAENGESKPKEAEQNDDPKASEAPARGDDGVVERGELTDKRVREMPSREDSVVGLWRAYGEGKGIGLGLGLDTPEKRTSAMSPGTPPGSASKHAKNVVADGSPMTQSVSSPRNRPSSAVGSGRAVNAPSISVRGNRTSMLRGSTPAASTTTSSRSRRVSGTGTSTSATTPALKSPKRSRPSQAGVTPSPKSTAIPTSTLPADTNSVTTITNTAPDSADSAAVITKSPAPLATNSVPTPGPGPGPGSSSTAVRARVPSKASTVGRGGNVVSSRKRDLGGRI
ncbi:hypothetical protein I317_06133 [Kwoniella heveanensis CBS 569]|nr:hypothetical protein I317_06133 [Kwoniella heveanensis CBS 569]